MMVVMVPLMAAIGQAIIKLMLGLVAVFLILLVLVQRGRGGGLAGALGGMGGSSAFGAKAGDVFTRITIVAATFWIFLCIAAAKMGPSTESRIQTDGVTSSAVDVGPKMDSIEPAEEAAAESEQTEATEAAEAAVGSNDDSANAAAPSADSASPAESNAAEEAPVDGEEK